MILREQNALFSRLSIGHVLNHDGRDSASHRSAYSTEPCPSQSSGARTKASQKCPGHGARHTATNGACDGSDGGRLTDLTPVNSPAYQLQLTQAQFPRSML